jgi:hypothetical protein
MSSRAKRKWQHRQNVIHPELRRQLTSRGLWNGPGSVARFDGEQKMSAVLLDFVAPYTAKAESEAEFRTAIEMGLIAWNIALFPPDVRKEHVDFLIESAVHENVAEFKEVITEMVARKERYFPDCRRWILAHCLEITRRGPSLTVVSSPE